MKTGIYIAAVMLFLISQYRNPQYTKQATKPVYNLLQRPKPRYSIPEGNHT